MSVVARRTKRLRKLYFKGIAMDYCSFIVALAFQVAEKLF